MKRIAVAAALILALSACASRTGPPADPHNPQVSVSPDGTISVDPDPIRIPKNEKDITITWHLPKGLAHSFVRDGIVITSPDGEFTDCHVADDNFSFTCLDKHSKPGKYKYTIKVQRGNSPLPPFDPWIEND